MCDGFSRAELLGRMRERIDRFGFTMTFVESVPSWAYTTGLVEGYAHPEVVVTGLCAHEASDLLTEVADAVRAGRRFDGPGSELSLPGLTLRFGDVHWAQWAHGRFNAWFEYYDWVGRQPDPLAVQLLWPDQTGLYPPAQVPCGEHPGPCQPVLDADPGHDVNGRNRAERRRHARRHR